MRNLAVVICGLVLVITQYSRTFSSSWRQSSRVFCEWIWNATNSRPILDLFQGRHTYRQDKNAILNGEKHFGSYNQLQFSHKDSRFLCRYSMWCELTIGSAILAILSGSAKSSKGTKRISTFPIRKRMHQFDSFVCVTECWNLLMRW